jgi:single-strand DNA-binding protein
MASFNKIIIVGYLGRDPELRYTPQGTPVCDFSIATTERKKDKTGEFQDATTWFRVTLWNRLAELASQYLTKGRQVYVEGRLVAREWQDKEGITRTSLDVTATDVHFIGPRGEESPVASRSEPAAKEAPQPSITDDDVPF